MNKTNILDILNDWNFWAEDQSVGIARTNYLNLLASYLNTNQLIVLIGARRSGKSFLMRQMAKSLIDNGIDRKNILIVNFEDPRFSKLDANMLQEIYNVYLEEIRPDKMPFLFLDEIDEVQGWEKWARMMHELNKAKILISGSNANLLNKELSTVLTGRHLDLTVYPLSFREYLEFNKFEIRNNLDIINKKIEIRILLKEYLESGGFPEVVLSDRKKQILFSYFEDVLNKDIIRRFNIRKSQHLKALVNFHFSNISSPTTFNSVEKYLKISADTVHRFDDYLEQAYLFFMLKRFSFKIKEQEKSPRKVYAIDVGLANAVGFRFMENPGRLAENIVFLQLKRKQIDNPGMEIYYWKDNQQREVDFLIKQGAKPTEIIQVCWSVDDIKTKTREINSSVSAMNNLNMDSSTIITDNYEGEEKVENKMIKYKPLYKYLLE